MKSLNSQKHKTGLPKILGLKLDDKIQEVYFWHFLLIVDNDLRFSFHKRSGWYVTLIQTNTSSMSSISKRNPYSIYTY